jgi:hypothetical protein
VRSFSLHARYHVAAGRKSQITNALLKAAESVVQAEDMQASVKERERIENQRWRAFCNKLSELATIIALTRLPAWTIVLPGVSVLPLLAQVLCLRYFPSRYAFPHVWPGLLLISLTCAQLCSQGTREKALGYLVIVAAVSCMAWRSAAIITHPQLTLHLSDARQFLGSHSYAGFGSREAVFFLTKEAKQEPFILLTDPYWGPPANVMFAYLNERRGIQVYEA